MNRSISLVLLFVLAACSKSTPETTNRVVVTIDESITYQRMQGFGGFGAQKVWWAEEPFYSDEFVDLLINDLGLTILRDNLPIAFEPENDNDDYLSIDWSGYNYSEQYPGVDSHLGQHLPYLKAMHEAGLEKLIVSIWSPPVWMKHNNHRGNGSDTVERRTSAPTYSSSPNEHTNQLREDLYEEFAEYCVAYIRLLKQETGIDLYAMSLQNEPRFSQFYASAVHSPESLRDLIKVVGARFEQEGIETKIFAPEDVQNLDAVLLYLRAIFEDPLATKYMDIVAIHNYRGDGVQPSDSSPKNWTETANLASMHSKEVWMTETSGYDPQSFDSAMDLAKSIYNALRYGQVSAWVYWQMSGKNLIDAAGQKTYLYFISQQFYRHIKTGSLRIEASSSETDLLTLAFIEPQTKSQTLVLINIGAQALEVKLEGKDVREQYRVRQTSVKSFHQAQQDILREQLISVPAKSLATLVSN